MGVMRILGPEGDTAVAWATDDEASVRDAEALFRQLIDADGLVPFARTDGATAADAEQITVFDPAVDEILWIRPITGG